MVLFCVLLCCKCRSYHGISEVQENTKILATEFDLNIEVERHSNVGKENYDLELLPCISLINFQYQLFKMPRTFWQSRSVEKNDQLTSGFIDQWPALGWSRSSFG